MKLSEAMRKGIELSKPTRYELTDVRDDGMHACALGAIALGRWKIEELPVFASDLYNMLFAEWPELETIKLVVPELGEEHVSLGQAIFRKNDDLDVPREQTADWLESIGY